MRVEILRCTNPASRCKGFAISVDGTVVKGSCGGPYTTVESVEICAPLAPEVQRVVVLADKIAADCEALCHVGDKALCHVGDKHFKTYATGPTLNRISRYWALRVAMPACPSDAQSLEPTFPPLDLEEDAP